MMPKADAGALKRTDYSETAAISAIRSSKRIIEVDIVRGFALLGIIVVNFKAPSLGGLSYGSDSGSDQLAGWLIENLAAGVFYPLFSILFGLGVALQIQKAQSSGVAFAAMYWRRLLVLFVIGLIHALLVWKGDILHIYAVFGVFILFVLRRSSRTLLLVAIICMITARLAGPIANGLSEIFATKPTDTMLSEIIETGSIDAINPESSLLVTSTYRELITVRANLLAGIYSQPGRYLALLDVFSLFLFGFLVGRSEVLQHISENLGLIRKVMLLALVVVVIGRGWHFVLQRVGVSLDLNTGWPSGLYRYLVDDPKLWELSKLYRPFLSVFYACAIILLFHHKRWARTLSVLEAAGRLALTNYLLQSLIGTTLFYGYGFALYGKLGNAAGTVLAVGVFGLQILLSVWWLRRYRFGPVEWLWRSLTYGRIEPLYLAEPSRLR